MLIVGLGNIGKEYSHTRHNIGRWAVEQYCFDNSIELSVNKKLRSQVGKKGDAVFVLPMLYMNESGVAVGLCAKWFDVLPSNIVIVHDEFDLAEGDVRLKVGGGSAGHNGIKSVENHLGVSDFQRIRIGIGKPSSAQQGASYVLKHMSDAKWENLCDNSYKAIELIDELV